MKIDLFCLCWNEIKILPFVVEYWKLVADHVYVYDNGSTDGSVEYLEQFDWITVKHFDSDGFNDGIHMYIKNHCWKESDADWVIVCDLDECLWHPNIREYIEQIPEDVTIINPRWIECFSERFPEYKEGTLLHTLVDGGSIVDGGNEILAKRIMFRPNKIKEINYGPGAHRCSPIGDVKVGYCLNIFHFKNLGIDYVMSRYEDYKNRLSPTNKKYGYGYHYNIPRVEHEKHIEERRKSLKDINDCLLI